MKTRKLGTQGLEVSALGFGCMGLSGVYNAPLDQDRATAVLQKALEAGITFFDTAEIYGMTTNVTTPVLYALGTLTTLFSFTVIGLFLAGAVILRRRRLRRTGAAG